MAYFDTDLLSSNQALGKRSKAPNFAGMVGAQRSTSTSGKSTWKILYAPELLATKNDVVLVGGRDWKHKPPTDSDLVDFFYATRTSAPPVEFNEELLGRIQKAANEVATNLQAAPQLDSTSAEVTERSFFDLEYLAQILPGAMLSAVVWCVVLFLSSLSSGNLVDTVASGAALCLSTLLAVHTFRIRAAARRKINRC